jgi:PncC family amidohydrolase
MDNLISSIRRKLIKKRKTVSLAESCTGGIISSLLTRDPGSAKYFILGAVTYSNRAKSKILNIPPSLFKTKGTVSQEVAVKMARSVRKISGSDFGIGVTGIAGPTGGTQTKPVGTVFIAAASHKKVICKKFLFKGTRAKIRMAAVLGSLKLLQSLL